jgi:hypothetical protein
MKILKWILIAVLFTVVALSIAACGGEEASAPEPTAVIQIATDTPTLPPPTNTPLPPPTDTPSPEPTEPPAPEGGTESGQGLDFGALGEPSKLDSFRSSMTISWQGIYTDGTEASETMMIAVEFVREPPAQHVTISGNFPGVEELGLEEGEVLEMYVSEGVMYMNLFGTWIQAPAEEGALDADEMAFVATEEMLKGLEDASYEGSTTYNGIEVEHYSFDETSFGLGQLPEGMDVEEALGNIYVAKEGNYLVHMDMAMSGANMELPTGQVGQILEDGSMEITVNLTDINQPITIVVPEEAQASGAPPEDIPVPDNAEDLQVVGFMGMITFSSSDSPEAVADYYQAEMPNNGWTESSVDEMGGMYSLEYTKGDRTASLLINPDSETGQTSVLITIEGGG